MNRRRLLEKIVQGFAVAGLGLVAYPFVKAFLPSFEEDLSLEVSVDDLAPGESKLVHWLGRNVVVRRRTKEMLAAIASPTLNLKDPDSGDSDQPDFARNAWRSRDPEVFVAFDNCTHLGCEVMTADRAGVGFKCPCHASDYDHAGRVVEGAAAPLNLVVPNYRFVSRNTLVLEAS